MFFTVIRSPCTTELRVFINVCHGCFPVQE